MQENLKREIGTFSLASAVVNITIGTGIFVLPALAAENLGAAAIVCFFICGALIFLIALCFAEVGSKVTVSGGTYAYIENAFGPFAGFVANNVFWFGSCVLADAGMANALCKTLGYFFPILDSEIVHIIFFIVLFGGLAFINIRGAKYGVRFIIFTAFAKLIPLLLIIAFGMGRITAENLHWKHVLTVQNIGSSSLILFFAFCGIETAVTNSGEFKNPRRTVPLGILCGLAFVLLLYLSIQIVSQGVLGDRLTAVKDAPLAAVSNMLFGSIGITLVTVGTAISILGGISGEILAIPRVLFAGARDGIFPKALAKVHPQFLTPYVAIAIYTTLGFSFAVFGVLKQLLILSTAATLLIYLGVVLATIKLRVEKSGDSEKGFKIPGGIIVPVLATITIIWLLSNLSREEIKGSCIFIAALIVIYFLMNLFKNKRVQFATAKNNPEQLEK